MFKGCTDKRLNLLQCALQEHHVLYFIFVYQTDLLHGKIQPSIKSVRKVTVYGINGALHEFHVANSRQL